MYIRALCLCLVLMEVKRKCLISWDSCVAIWELGPEAQVLCKSSNYSYPFGHLSNPEFGHIIQIRIPVISAT